jgi:hypothetical protein
MGSFGTDAGQMVAPRGVAVEPVTSDVYVGDLANRRIDEFTPWGEFVKAFGWDVAPGPVDEEQEVRIRATAGQFRLTYEAATTPDLPFDASADEVDAALDALPSINAGGGSVTVEGVSGGNPGTTPTIYVVRFDGGPLQDADLAQLTVETGTIPLSGGNPTTHEARTIADGTAGGTALESCTAASGCQPGSSGGGAGQMLTPGGVAFDGDANLYVFDLQNERVQKYDAAGRFIWMVGGEVNKTTGTEFCAKANLEASEVCGAGVSGGGPREFQVMSEIGTSGDFIEIGNNGNLYVGDKDRIQELTTAGAFVEEIKYSDVHAGAPAFPTAGQPGGLAVDPTSGALYFTFGQPSFSTKIDNVFKISPAGDLLDVLAVKAPEAVGTDDQGNLYAVEKPEGGASRVIGLDSSGVKLFAYPEGIEGDSEARLLGLASNLVGDLFVTNALPPQQVDHVAVYGPPPVDLRPPPLEAPEIDSEYAISVSENTATVQASINPHLWNDTHYYLEYGLEPCASSACTKLPTPPGPLLTSDFVDASLATEAIVLSGLEPGATYHFRFVAKSSGGGPTIGEDSTFTTRRVPPEPPVCPATELSPRSTMSQKLPDCRVYEMVSPVDKNGGDLVPLCNITCYPAALDQSAQAGAKLTYGTYNSFGDAQSSPYASQYLARRIAGKGWDTEGITPSQDGTSDLDRLFRAFSADLEFGWIYREYPPALSPGSETPNLYRRDNSDGSYLTLVPGQPLGTVSTPQRFPELQGITPNGSCAAFTVKDNLTVNAMSGLSQAYRSCDGNVTLVSVLPGGAASTNPSSVGTPQIPPNGREGSMFNAISDDGQRVFWSESNPGAEQLYIRIADTSTKAISAGSATFWGAASDGSRVIYQEGGALKEATIDAGGTVSAATIATQAIGVAGMSEDALRVYFASRDDLDGPGGAVAGEPNLYLLETASPSSPPGSGELSFIAPLSELDVQAGKVSLVAPRPTYRQSRVSPDGGHLAFMSRGQLTGYDNTDQKNGKPDAEVFLYSAAEDSLVCASCNPTGARPEGQETKFGIKGSFTTGVQAAANLPNFNSQLYASRALADGGSRLFFEAYDRLDPDDVNEALDVYQWEQLGAGPPEDECEEQDASFDPKSGGCIDLISYGNSALDSEFLDASASGDDVFFSSDSSLISADPGQVDIYDARVGGGLPEPSAPETGKEQCSPGVDCQPAVPPPSAPPAPQSEASGPPNDTYARPKPPKHCRRGTHKAKKRGKVRCVKNSKHKRGNAGKSGRAGR